MKDFLGDNFIITPNPLCQKEETSNPPFSKGGGGDYHVVWV
jgi:hypothetical protein